MAARNEFVAHVLDQLEGLGSPTSRAMFGGHGIYVDGVIVGLVVNDTLYLKVDDRNRSRFEQAQGVPFTYHNKRTGQDQAMSYWTIPDHVLDDAGAMVEWGRTSLDASLRAREKPAAKASSSRRSKSVDKPTAKPASKPAAKPASKPAARVVAKPMVMPSTKTAAKIAAKPVAKRAAKSVTKPAAKPAAKSAARNGTAKAKRLS
ncbi:MAG TPA: TfoX/Sxy family protein [Vulgatibacter sp.]